MDRSEAALVFIRVVDEGDFSAAARRLRMTPSAVSKHVTRLEDRLGVRLFHRSTRKLSLTEEGRIYESWARRILTDIEEAERAVQRSGGEARGRLRVSLPLALGHRQIVPLLPEFCRRYPEVELDLSFTNAIVDLIDEGVDVAIRLSALRDSRLIARRLAVNRRLVCAAPAYIARRGAPQSPEDLVNHSCLGFTGQGNLSIWAFEGPDGPTAIPVRPALEANSGEALLELACAGMGLVSFSAFLVAPEIKAGRLVPVLSAFKHPDGPPISVVYAERRHLSPRLRVFIDYLVEAFTPPPWERL